MVARARHLVPLHRGVYAVGHAHLRPNGYRLAAVLAVGPGAALSHRDAAAIDVSTPAERRSTRRIRVHGRRRLDVDDVTTVEGIAVTTVARTLTDLAEVVAADALHKALSEAERQRVLDVRAIEEVLKRVRGRRGPATAKLRAALEELAHHGATLTRSPLEDRLVPLLDAHRLPRPATNAYVEGYQGDAVWHRQRLVVGAAARGRRGGREGAAQPSCLIRSTASSRRSSGVVSEMRKKPSPEAP